MQVGRSVNADNTIARHTTTFGPNETVYVSVEVFLDGQSIGTKTFRASADVLPRLYNACI